MANIASAKKAIRSSAKKKLVNDRYREKFRSAVKAFNDAVEAGESKKKLEELLQNAYKQIDKSAKKTVNVISENKAARMKSKLAKSLS
jgi:small subunit ribosomal protein S20